MSKPNCLVCNKSLSRNDAKRCKIHRVVPVSLEMRQLARLRMTGNQYAKGKNIGNTFGFKRGVPSWNKGIGLPWIKGDKHPLWKGDKVSYRNLHRWLVQHLGQPDTCEFCGKSGLSGRFIHWANKSGKYLRDLTDWIRLCAKCHKYYDLRRNNNR